MLFDSGGNQDGYACFLLIETGSLVIQRRLAAQHAACLARQLDAGFAAQPHLSGVFIQQVAACFSIQAGRYGIEKEIA
ncbi:hypothetical protein SDC9_115019 [bioreactor metagenome]|uniref:Uncharacterized protein n=1 Tax=bioreactor metagenome TaxID=1076179 RepID=A0A645BSN1_9ZZZZ